MQLDPTVIFDTVAKGSVVQTANGTILVRDRVVPRAIICIMVRGKGSNYKLLWHNALSDQHPTSSGPSTTLKTTRWAKEDGGWTRKQGGLGWTRTTQGEQDGRAPG